MAFSTKVTDWQVCGFSGLAGGAVIAAGLYKFIFYSQQAGVSESFLLKGVGLGVGGNASGLVVPQDFGDLGSPWSSIDCNQAFSAADLRGAWGRPDYARWWYWYTVCSCVFDRSGSFLVNREFF